MNPYQPPNPYQAPMDDAVMATPMDGGLKWLLFSFDGRIPRRTFWGASIATAFVFYAAAFATMSIGETVGAILTIALYIPFLWVSLAIQIKRWHDRGKSGWWFCIGFVPLIGGIWAFVETGCLRGTFGPNQYGADPT